MRLIGLSENTNLNTLYRGHYIGTSTAGMRVIRGAVICFLITIVILAGAFKYGAMFIDWILYNPQLVILFDETTLYAATTVLGFSEANQRIDKVIQYSRVSSKDQSRKYGKLRQEPPLEKEFEKLDTDQKIKINSDWESGRTMLRDNIETIIEILEAESDKQICLMIQDMDRLSRAPPLEALTFLWILQQFDALIYIHEEGYFDLTNLEQQESLADEVIRARRDYENLLHNTSEGAKSSKELGGFPGPAPYGFKKQLIKVYDDTFEILRRDNQQVSVLEDFYDLVIKQKESVDRAINELEKKHDETQVPIKPTFKRIFDRRHYFGQLMHEGEQVGRCPPIFTHEEMHKVRNILNLEGEIGSHTENNNENRKSNLELDHEFVNLVFEVFGPDAAIEEFETIKGRCPRCGDDVEKWGSATRQGHRVNKYRCVNYPDKEDAISNSDEGQNIKKESNDELPSNDENLVCKFEGPLLTGKIIREWNRTLPLTCPKCKDVLKDENWSTDPTKLKGIQQICDCCGLNVSVDVSDCKDERVIGNSEHKLDIFDNNNDMQDRKDESDKAQERDSERNNASSEDDPTSLDYWC